MDVRVLSAPVFAALVLGLVIAAVVWGRPGARARWPSWPLAWAVLSGCGALILLSQMGLGPHAWVSAKTLAQLLAAAVLAVACVTGFRGTALRKRAELLMSSAPRALDEGVKRLREGEPSAQGVFRGRLGADHEVTSPGGVVCAFYEAQVRQRRFDGQKGSLLTSERSSPDTVWLRGERVEALVSFSIEAAFGPEEAHRCQVTQRLAYDQGRAYVEGEVPAEAVSFEKLGRRGEPCLVVGELRRGPVPGGYLIQGAGGGPAMVVLADDVLPIARTVLRRSWTRFAAAAGLCCAAAWLFTW